ncbi:hypothetical protein F5X97DRAFT_338381 [Nemania serpens]|nr:hypothetical protein F5X97DRAFT_338381 [Nemania serpens]
MPFKLHHWDVDSETSLDVGWPRRYLTYDIHTSCGACHEPNGIRRICQYLFGGPATRCLHHRGRNDRRSAFYSNNGWGGGVRGFVRAKGCKNPDHYALSFQRCIDTSSFPEKLGPRDRFRSRLPEACYDHTPRGHKPNYIWCLSGYDYHYAGDWGRDPGDGAEAVASLPYSVYEPNGAGYSPHIHDPVRDANAGTTLRGGHGDYGRDGTGRNEREKEKRKRKGRGRR